jgi:alpha-glucosidase
LVKTSEETGRSLTLNYLGQPSGLVDYTDPAVASYWHSIFRNPIVDGGASSFFLVGGEPESYSTLAWYRGIGGQGEHSHFSWANRFSLKWMEGFWIGLQNQRYRPGGGKRLFLLARAGLAGQGRHGAGLYSVEPFFFAPLPQIQARANLHLSGIDYFATDVYPMFQQFPLERFNNNYAAWLAKNVLLNIPLLIPQSFLNEPWTEPNLRLKARLEPYFYSLAHQANLTGEPLMSPLLYYFQEDLAAREASYEVMIGPHVLVAAGVMPAAEVLSFYLPAGRWYDFHGQEVISQAAGGQRTLPCKQNGISMSPTLLRAGAVVPMSTENPAMEGRLHVLVFPGEAQTSFDLYEDNGVNISYLSGERVRITLEMNPAAVGLTFKIKAQAGQMPGAVKERGFLLEFVGVGNLGTVSLNGESFRRLPTEGDLNEPGPGWFSAGTGRLVFKTSVLDLTKDHEIILR